MTARPAGQTVRARSDVEVASVSKAELSDVLRRDGEAVHAWTETLQEEEAFELADGALRVPLDPAAGASDPQDRDDDAPS